MTTYLAYAAGFGEDGLGEVSLTPADVLAREREVIQAKSHWLIPAATREARQTAFGLIGLVGQAPIEVFAHAYQTGSVLVYAIPKANLTVDALADFWTKEAPPAHREAEKARFAAVVRGEPFLVVAWGENRGTALALISEWLASVSDDAEEVGMYATCSGVWERERGDGE